MAAEQLQLSVTGAPLPPDFVGTPQAFYEAILTRMRVIFPTGQTSFVISDTEPSTNLGPWLKNGIQWYVFDDTTHRYIPQDLSHCNLLIAIAETAPADGTKPLWLQYKGTRVIRWNVWLDGGWKPLTNRGTTAQRPSDPVDYERYEDTTIATEIVYYGGSWHTVSGVPGDVKHVIFNTLAEALERNPGWQEVGQFLSDDGARGRSLVVAHKDAGGSPVAVFTPAAGSTSRAAREKFGAETHVLTMAELPAAGVEGKGPIFVDATHLYHDTTHGAPVPFGDVGYVPAASAGFYTRAQPIFKTDNLGSGTGHSTLGPGLALWTLVKL